jgi:hypothetical protein
VTEATIPPKMTAAPFMIVESNREGGVGKKWSEVKSGTFSVHLAPYEGDTCDGALCDTCDGHLGGLKRGGHLCL